MMSLETVGRFRGKIFTGATDRNCWLWIGTKDGSGYGLLYINGHLVKAHRFAYELLVGSIPEGLTIDHLCRNRACVNPDHLEPVTMRTNLLRGNGWAAQNARKAHCPQGHPFDEQNTYYDPKGGRRCRVCRRH